VSNSFFQFVTIGPEIVYHRVVQNKQTLQAVQDNTARRPTLYLKTITKKAPQTTKKVW
jgi:hypothetical protein